jgi:hypothetical protein
MLKSKVVIEIRGGCLTRVLSDIPNTEVELFDWDDKIESAEEIKRKERRYKKQAKNKSIVW